MSRIEAFPRPTRTYKTYMKAKKIITSLEDGNYKWSIICTEEGRYFPHIFLSTKNTHLSHFYFIEKGCCVTMESS